MACGIASLALGLFAIVVSAGRGAGGILVSPSPSKSPTSARLPAHRTQGGRAPLLATPITVPPAATQVAPLLPPLAHPLLAAVQQDRYYHLLLPLSLPVVIAAITSNWFSMKLFKHNS